MRKRKAVEPRTLSLWEATFAAAFVSRYYELARISSIDAAIEMASCHAEEAEAVADLAIEALADWRKDGKA